MKASVPGKVFKVEASVGQAVKAGDSIVILEAMKIKQWEPEEAAHIPF